MQIYEPQLVLKTYDLYLHFYTEIRKWPKPERYNLGKRCEDLILDILDNLTRALTDRNKKFSLAEADVKIQQLKLLFRLANELKIMEYRKYLFFEVKILEIGKMLGGWLKTA